MKNFIEKQEYKIFQVSSFMAHTTVNTFKVVGFLDNKPIILFKNHKGNYERKKRLLRDDNKDLIIIPLKDCILKTDSETGNFMGNACFNFMNTEEEIREQLKLNMVEDFSARWDINMVTPERQYIKIIEGC